VSASISSEALALLQVIERDPEAVARACAQRDVA
jgi:hypothetical protein